MKSSSRSSSARALLAHRPFSRFLWARGLSEFAYQMAAVAVGWQIYSLTHSAFALGMIGLTQFLPSACLLLVAGHAADRYERKRIMQIGQLVRALAAAFLAWGSLAGWLNVTEIFAAVAVLGAAMAFERPAGAALLTAVVPRGSLQQGTALSFGAYQTAAITAPALAGLVYAIRPAAPYALMAGLWVLSSCLNAAIKPDRPAEPREQPDASSLLAGVRFVRENPAILGTISLDLVAVLLGGAAALLPIYARDILHTGPWGLGVLRGGPAIGALFMTMVLARHPLNRRVGMRLFHAVMLFGFATVVFSLSRWMWLSLAALAVMGAADTVSVVIRTSLVQLATPDDMRGRVGAINYLFVNASNQLGEFESGLTAALLGAVPAAALGGVGCIAVALLWMRLFPTLRDIERLESHP